MEKEKKVLHLFCVEERIKSKNLISDDTFGFGHDELPFTELLLTI